MAHVYVDWTPDHNEITVRVMTGLRGDRTKRFPARQLTEARAYADSKMGQKGMVLDNTYAERKG